jgi:putative transposase
MVSATAGFRPQVKRRGGRNRALGTAFGRRVPSAPNQWWSLEFVADSLAEGRCFRILAVVDDISRERLAMVAATSIGRARVIR